VLGKPDLSVGDFPMRYNILGDHVHIPPIPVDFWLMGGI